MSLGANDLRLETVEFAAHADLFCAAPPVPAGELGVSSLEIGGAFCGAVTALPGARTFNRVAGLGVGAAVEDRQLDAIAAFYASLRLGYVISLAPGPDSEGLERRLLARGYEPDYAWVKFARPVAPLPEAETQLRVEAVGADRAHDFGTVVAGGFGLPPLGRRLVRGAARAPGLDLLRGLRRRPPRRRRRGVHRRAGGLARPGSDAARAPPQGRPGRDPRRAGSRRPPRPAATWSCTETGAVEEGRPSNSYRNIERSGFEATYTRPNLRNPEGG